MDANTPSGRTGRRARVALLAATILTVAVAGNLAVSTTLPGRAEATIGVDDYPNFADGSVDPWRFIAGYCTSFVAWRLNNDNHLAFTNGMGGGWFGNATNWGDNARALGYRVDTTPAVGAVAQWTGADMPTSGGMGHVSWVKQVNSDGSVVVEEYNYYQRFTYDQRITGAPHYIHLQDLGWSPPPTDPPPTAPPTTAPPSQAPVPVPFTSWSAFVQKQFLDTFARPPTANEATSWGNLLSNGDLDPDVFTSTLVDSGPLPSFLGPVTRLYNAYFRRPPDSAGLSFWVGQNWGGMSLNAISSSFAQSQEFVNTYGWLDQNGFVTQLYNNTMGRAPDSGGLAYWVDELNSGRLSRGDVMVGFSESNEFKFRSNAGTQVTVIYEALLNRAPDPGGWSYWSGVLPTGPNTEAVLIKAIRTSQEYRNRIGG